MLQMMLFHAIFTVAQILFHQLKENTNCQCSRLGCYVCQKVFYCENNKNRIYRWLINITQFLNHVFSAQTTDQKLRS